MEYDRNSADDAAQNGDVTPRQDDSANAGSQYGGYRSAGQPSPGTPPAAPSSAYGQPPRAGVPRMPQQTAPGGAQPPPPPGYQGPPPQYARSGGGGGRRGPMTAVWIILLLVALSGATVVVGLFVVGSMTSTGPSLGSEQIGIIPIMGVIQDGGRGTVFGGQPGSRAIMADIRAAAKDDSVKAVVVLINSPGGSAAASEAIYAEIKKLSEKKKVVACMADVAASGGYYVAAAADQIVAHQATVTGSIGVIMGGLNFHELMQRYGVADATHKSGQYKDIGSPLRPAQPGEGELIDQMLQDVHEQFITAVAEGRNMEAAEVRKLADGRLYTGAQAKQAGLVDEIGNYYDAIELAAELAGIKGEPRTKLMTRPRGLFSDLMDLQGVLRPGRSVLDLPIGGMPLCGPVLIAPEAFMLVPLGYGFEQTVPPMLPH